MPHKLYIGIDGGGTHSRAAAVREDGRLIAACEGGSLNFHTIGMEAARQHLSDMLKNLRAQTGSDAFRVCAGLSALDGPADESLTAAFATEYAAPDQLDMQSDAYVALMGFNLGKPGVIVICGTGSMMLMLDSCGKQTVSGGWGYRLEDAGSGFSLAHEGLLSAISAFEGWGPSTGLKEDALSYFASSSGRSLIDQVYAPDMTPSKFAGFAKLVLERASKDDEEALQVVHREMKKLAYQTSCLLKKDPKVTAVGRYGGIFAHSQLASALYEQALLKLSPQAEPKEMTFPPEIGAVIHLLQKDGLLSSQVIQNLHESLDPSAAIHESLQKP